MLEYDNSAFYYFGITFLSLYCLPMTYYSAKRLVLAFFFRDSFLSSTNSARSSVSCEKERKKIRKLQEENLKLSAIFTFKYMLNLLVLFVCWFCLYQLIRLVENDSQIKTFDPFVILDIASGASDRQIKKAYRKMSLLYHPDKNKGDSIAETKFMLVAKAYEALTDEAAKANYEKYGNPDGRQSLQLSIGLPTFLLNKANHNLILFLYLIVLVVIIPCCVALWYTNSKKYGDSNILYDSYGFYNYALSEHAHLKMMPEILSGSAEFRENIPLRPEDEKDLSNLQRDLKQDNLLGKTRFNHPSITKANLLLHAHIHRIPLTPRLQGDLLKILKHSMHLLEGMMEICLMKCWLQTTLNVIEFEQYLTQALWVNSCKSGVSLLQLPHFTESEVKHVVGGSSKIRDLSSYLRQDEKDRKGLATMTDSEKETVNSVLKNLPLVDIKVEVGVEDEDFIAEGDVMTITITLTRLNMKEDEEVCDLVYAPHFPFPKEENWLCIIGDVKNNYLRGFAKMTSQNRVVTEKIQMQAPQKPGSYQIELYVKSDSYIGLDHKETLKFTVVSAEELPAYVPHPEDLELDNEPTLFEQVMSGAAANDSSDSEVESDSDSEDDESTEGRLLSSKEKKQQ